jgi:MFS family permease
MAKLLSYTMKQTPQFIARFTHYNRNTKILIFGSFVVGIVMSIFGFTASLYLYALGYTTVEIGEIGAVSMATTAIFLIPAGYLTDRYNKKKLMLLGASLNSVFLLLYVLPAFPVLIFANILGGIGNSIVMPNISALLAENSNSDNRKFVFTTNALMNQIGNALGTALGGVMPDLIKNTSFGSIILGFQFVFIIAFFFTILRLASIFFLDVKQTPTERKGMLIPGSWKLISKFALTQMLIGFGAGVTIPWFQIYFKIRFDASYTSLGIAFFATNVIMGISLLIMPLLAERKGSVFAIIVTQALAIVVLVAIPNTDVFLIAVIFYIIRSVLMNIANPIVNAFTMSVVPANERGAATAMNTLAWNATWSAGYYVGGYVISQNLELIFYITAVFYVLYITTFYIFFRKYDDAKKNNLPSRINIT